MIINGRHGTIKPYISAPKEFLNVLREHRHVDNFPVPVEEIYYITFINISEISKVLTEKRLIIQPLIPLVKDKILELTRVISLPRHGWLRQSIVDITQRLILDPFRTFMSVNELELPLAKKLGKYQLFKRIDPDYKVGIKDSYLTEIIIKCDTEKYTIKYMQIQNTLRITNRVRLESLQKNFCILCSDKIPRNVPVYQNFILHLEPDYTVFDTAILKPDNLLRNKIEFHKTTHLVESRIN